MFLSIRLLGFLVVLFNFVMGFIGFVLGFLFVVFGEVLLMVWDILLLVGFLVFNLDVGLFFFGFIDNLFRFLGCVKRCGIIFNSVFCIVRMLFGCSV